MRGPRPLDHRFGEPALLAEPVLRAPTEFGDRVFGEERRRDPRRRRLLGDRLHAVLAELRDVRVSRLGPGAAGTVEAVGLVQRPQRRQRPARPHAVRRPGGATPRRPWPRRPNPWAVRRCRRTPRAGQSTVITIECRSRPCSSSSATRRQDRSWPSTSDRSDCAHDVIDRLPPRSTRCRATSTSPRRFRRQGDPRRQRRVEVRTHPAVHRPRGAARAVHGPRLHRRRIPVQPVRRARSPARAEEIETFCSTTYGVTFPMMEKIDVNGEVAAPDLRRARPRSPTPRAIPATSGGTSRSS